MPAIHHRPSPTARLLVGLAVTLSAVAVYSGYTILQLKGLEQLQSNTIDRNRIDSLLLLRIQNNLNSIALAMRDMVDAGEPYPLAAWQGPFKRIRTDLADALAQEERYSPTDPAGDRDREQRRYLTASVAQFWDALDRIFAQARSGQEKEARALVRLSLQARQESLSTAVARLLIQNNETEKAAAEHTRQIYARVTRNVYIFLAAMLVLILLTGLYIVHYNRRLFNELGALAKSRSDLAQQLISMQENTFRSISRELHDEFGQILTAIGAMLHRTERKAPEGFREDLREIQEIVQSTLEKVRSLSHALHPVALDEMGFEGAVDAYLPLFEHRTGVEIGYEKTGVGRELEQNVAIHLYRIMQEALNNVARHSKSARAVVRLHYLPSSVVLEVEDQGVGFGSKEQNGLGLVSMRERGELVNARVEFTDGAAGGALIRVTVAHA
jgi:signal transduction histidine kinase